MPEDVRTLGSLFRGGVFGSLEDRPRATQSCTVMCTSASCELFYASSRCIDLLPATIRRSTQKYLCHTTEWRLDDEKRLDPSPTSRPSSRQSNISNGRNTEMGRALSQTRLRRASNPTIMPPHSRPRRASETSVKLPGQSRATSAGCLTRQSPGSASLPLLPLWKTECA